MLRAQQTHRPALVLAALVVATFSMNALADDAPGAATIGPETHKLRAVHLEYAEFAETQHKARMDEARKKRAHAETRMRRRAFQIPRLEAARADQRPHAPAARVVVTTHKKRRLGPFCHVESPSAPRVPALDARGRDDVKCVFAP